MLNRLVQLQLVQRTKTLQDRRFKQIELTDKGRQLLDESICARLSWFEDLAKLLAPDEQAKVVAALTILIERAGRLDTSPE